MRVAVFSAKPHDQRHFDPVVAPHHELTYHEFPLGPDTVELAAGYDAVCVFVNDVLDEVVINRLAELGVQAIALRCVGFNNVDLVAAEKARLLVVRVPEYSPAAVAEHTVALMLTLARHLHKAYNRVRDGNFMLRGLEGFTFHGRTAGVVGTGRIGEAVGRILLGMGMHVVAFDPVVNEELVRLGVEYAPFDELLQRSDVVTLHCPLNHDTHHLIDGERLALMKPGVMLINSSRGAVIDTAELIVALKSGHLGFLGLDVYEQEGDLFFRDLSDRIIQDDVFQRLLTFPNVVITGHLGFFTREALQQIALVTRDNLDDIEAARACPNALVSRAMVG